MSISLSRFHTSAWSQTVYIETPEHLKMQKTVFGYSSAPITKQKKKSSKCAIVTIANNCLHPNAGIDEEIRSVGGIPLQQSISERRDDDLANGVIFYETGSVVSTAAGNLTADYVFHAILQPIMNIHRLYICRFQIAYLLRKAYESIISTAKKLNVDYLFIPVIDPDILSTEESVGIAVTSISKCDYQIMEVTFVSTDVYEKYISKYQHDGSTRYPFSRIRLSDDIKFSGLNKSQKLFSSTFQPDEIACPSSVFSIGVTSKDPELTVADVMCIVVDKKLRYAGTSDSSVARYASEIEPPISDRKLYDNKFVFVSETPLMPHRNTMCIVVEAMSKISKNKSRTLQAIIGNIYVSILREAHSNGFKSIVLPVITLSNSDMGISIAIGIYACVNASTSFKFRHITFYHHDSKVINRFLYMLAFKRRRSIESTTFKSLFLQSFPVFPCNKNVMSKLPDLIRLLWDTIPVQVKVIPLPKLPVMHLSLRCTSSTNATTLTIMKADITTVPARNGAVVNAANGSLKFGVGIAAALRRAGGIGPANECDALMDLYAQKGINVLPAGSVAITSSGLITHCKKMIHAIGPALAQNARPRDEDLYRLQVTYEQVLRLAGAAKLDELIIPFLSTGAFGFDLLLGMKIALYAALRTLPNYGIKKITFVHKDAPPVQQFMALIGGNNELSFTNRSEADALLQTYCSAYIPSHSSSLKKKVDDEIESVWKVTQSLMTSNPNSYIQQATPAPAKVSIPTKRRVTPAPPHSHKRRAGETSVEQQSAASASRETEQEDKRRKAALKKAAQRKKQTPAQKAERLRKDRERKKSKRLSGNDVRTMNEDGEGDSDTGTSQRLSVVSSATGRSAPSTASRVETIEEYRERLRKMRERADARIATEDPSRKADRLHKKRSSTARARDSETPTQTSIRLNANRTSTARARDSETPTQTSIRLNANRTSTARARDNETPTQTSIRRNANRISTARARQIESRNERARRREEDKARKQARRDNETEDERIERRILDVLRHRKQRKNETAAQKAARKKRDAEVHYWHRHDPSRPIRKRGSRIITDEEKNYPQKLPAYYDLGPCPICKYCGAFTYSGRCCYGGQSHVRLPTAPPKFLQDLLIGESAEADHFRENILAYNRSLQMASVSCERERTRNSNPYVSINGALYHQMGGYNVPSDAAFPLFNQNYLFDPVEATAARMKNAPNLNEEIVYQLSRCAHKYNYLAKQFHMTSKIERALRRSGQQIPEKIIQLRTATRQELGGNHPGVLTRPMTELRSSVLFRPDEHGSAPAHGVFVYPEGKHMTQLQYFDPLTDPLCYPIMFMYGEGGYKYGEDKLHPKGTTREEAGFSYHNVEPDDCAIPSSSEQERYTSGNEGSQGSSEMSSSTRQGQLRRLVDYFDRNDELQYEPLRQIDNSVRPISPVEHGYSSDDDENDIPNWREQHSDEDDEEDEEEEEEEEADDDDNLAERVMTIRIESDDDDVTMGSPNEPLPTQQIAEEDDADAELPGIIEVPDDEAEYEQHEVFDGPEPLKDTSRSVVSRRQHYLYILRERCDPADPERRIFNPCGPSTHQLSQFYIIDQYLRMIRQRNDYARSKLVELRGSTAKSFMMAVLEQRAAKTNLNVGYSFQLSKRMPGSNAWYREKYINAMVMINKVGTPDLFITMTGNRKWAESENNFGAKSDWQSNPIVLCEVFHQKSQELLNDICNKEVFGRVAGYAYSIEFQKRGMPHMHLLVTLQKADKLDTPEKIEQHVWARIPEIDPLPNNPTAREKEKHNNQTRLRRLVTEFMIHSPCRGNRNAYCQTKLPPAHHRSPTWNQCSKKFPKELNPHTTILDDGSVNYYRPLGAMVTVKDSWKQEVQVGNEYVVPYSPYLLAKYESHINVECVSQIHVCKYMYKYIFKAGYKYSLNYTELIFSCNQYSCLQGFDRALVEFRDRVENNPNNDNQSRTTLQGGALVPDNYAKDSNKMDIAVRRMRTQARKLGVENDGEATANYDEAILTETFRQTTACEAAWGLLGYRLAGCSHKIKALNVHEPGNQPIAFLRGKEAQAERAVEEGRYISPFMAWMNLNRAAFDEDCGEDPLDDDPDTDDREFDEDEDVEMEQEDEADQEDDDEYGGNCKIVGDNGTDDEGSDVGDDVEDWGSNPATSGGRGQTQMPLPTQTPRFYGDLQSSARNSRATSFFDDLVSQRAASNEIYDYEGLADVEDRMRAMVLEENEWETEDDDVEDENYEGVAEGEERTRTVVEENPFDSVDDEVEDEEEENSREKELRKIFFDDVPQEGDWEPMDEDELDSGDDDDSEDASWNDGAWKS